ncbi:MAG: hypothetical protein R3B12_03560 [Candidatus Saccharimonadales bacterium]
MDIALSYSNNTPYAKRAVFHFREALWNELFMARYSKTEQQKGIGSTKQ